MVGIVGAVKILLAILASRRDYEPEAFARHTPVWLQHGFPVLVLTTTDGPIKSQFNTVRIGKMGGLSPLAIPRIKSQFVYLTSLDYDWFVVFETDCLCLSKTLPEGIWQKKGLWANVMTDITGRYYCKTWPSPPWVFDKESLVKFTTVAAMVRDDIERLASDRWMAVIADFGRIPLNSFGAQGFSTNNFWHSPEMPNFIRKGAVILHGIKDERALDCCRAAHQEYIKCNCPLCGKPQIDHYRLRDEMGVDDCIVCPK